MGVYDSQRFSKEFSVRTEANLAFIQRAVNQDRLESEYRNTFIAQYRQILEKVKDAVETIRRDANTIPAEQKKGKNKLKSSIYSLATELESNKNALERDLDALVSSKRFENDKLYEVTQLLNSLMGIAVLPYEMHKEIIKPRGNRSDSEEKRREVRDTWEYGQLHSFVMKLYKEGKWTTTYNEDRDSKGNINENTIGFNFLGHLRNAVCHSGDNAISILPLSEGKIIEEIFFLIN